MAIAAQSGNLDIVLEMIAYGARDVDWAMATAAGEGHKKIVEEMFVRGASDFNTAMIAAASAGHIDIVRLIIEIDKRRDKTIDFNQGLIVAARAGYIDIVLIMVARGARAFDLARAEAQKGGHMDIVWLLGN